jgi:hypothetical protein
MQANSTECVKKHQRGIKTDLRALLAGQAELREQPDEMRERLREICAMVAEQRQNGRDSHA